MSFYEINISPSLLLVNNKKADHISSLLKQMKQIAWKLEAEEGFCVIQCIYNEQKESISDQVQTRLGAVHYKKIDMCDAIYIVEIDGYIGTSAAAEILYAKEHGKELIFHSKQP